MKRFYVGDRFEAEKVRGFITVLTNTGVATRVGIDGELYIPAQLGGRLVMDTQIQDLCLEVEE
jgi:hypothetical protein